MTKFDQTQVPLEKEDLVIVKLDRRLVIDALGESPGWADPMEEVTLTSDL